MSEILEGVTKAWPSWWKTTKTEISLCARFSCRRTKVNSPQDHPMRSGYRH